MDTCKPLGKLYLVFVTFCYTHPIMERANKG